MLVTTYRVFSKYFINQPWGDEGGAYLPPLLIRKHMHIRIIEFKVHRYLRY